MFTKLLGTTALITSVAISSAALAGGGLHTNNSSTPSVSVGGFIDFQAGATDQDAAFETGANSREFKFQNDSEVHINVSGSTDTGLHYGASIELEADISADADGQGLNADNTYIYLESSELGRTELGGNSSAANALGVSAASVASATGGIGGDFYDYLNAPGATNIIVPTLPSYHQGTGTRSSATKITYFSPRFSGVQAGVSFTPDEGDAGSAASFTGETNGDQENVWSLGLNYEGAVSEHLTIATSLTGEFGDSEVATTEDLSAWAIGLSLDCSETGLSLAGSYSDWDDSGLAVGSNSDQDYWTLGAGYETGAYSMSLTYLSSETGSAEFDNLVVGADYQLAPGLVPYVEVSFFDTDDGVAGTTDNDGSVVLVGAELSF